MIKLRTLLGVSLGLGLISSASAATISWGSAYSITSPSDIINPGGSLVAALDFNTADMFGPEDATINGILFTRSDAAGSGAITTTLDSGPAHGEFSSVESGDPDLDSLLDSHSWQGGNPTTVTVTLGGLEPGMTYQVQLIGVGDERECCATRTYEPDDGTGNFNTGVTVQRGLNQTTIGTFIADGASQEILWRSLDDAEGNNDPGFSGMVVSLVPEPSSAALLLFGAVPFLFRRRR